MVPIIGAILSAFGLFLLLRSLWIRTGLTPRQTIMTLLAAAAVITLSGLAATGRLNWVVPAAAALVPVASRLGGLLKLGLLLHRLFPGWRGWPGWQRRFGARGNAGKQAAGDDVSHTETPMFRMTLDHRSGRMDGEILTGRHKGRFLSELGLAELLTLLADCADFDSQRLLEAFLDRGFPDWRRLDSEGPSPSGAMTRAEALEILGLSEGATRDDIVAAHRRLIQKLHPDRGGSTYLAAQINAARKVLLP